MKCPVESLLTMSPRRHGGIGVLFDTVVVSVLVRLLFAGFVLGVVASDSESGSSPLSLSCLPQWLPISGWHHLRRLCIFKPGVCFPARPGVYHCCRLVRGTTWESASRSCLYWDAGGLQPGGHISRGNQLPSRVQMSCSTTHTPLVPSHFRQA